MRVVQSTLDSQLFRIRQGVGNTVCAVYLPYERCVTCHRFLGGEVGNNTTVRGFNEGTVYSNRRCMGLQ